MSLDAASVIKSVNCTPTEKGGKRVVAAGVTTGSCRPEVKTAADGDVDGTSNVGVALLDAAARHGRPSDGVERGEVEAEDVAGSDADELGSVQNDLVEPQLGRFDVGLSDQRVDATRQVRRRR